MNSRRLREVMCPAISIGPNESIRTAAERMVESDVPAILVMDEGKIVGLLSNRDLVAKAVALSLSPDSTKVADVMSNQPVRISDDRDIGSALLVMQVRNVHQLVVQDITGGAVGVFCNCGCNICNEGAPNV